MTANCFTNSTARAQALLAVSKSQVMELLSAYHPEVVSTILVGLDIDGSDIDIVCCYGSAAAKDNYIHDVEAKLSAQRDYQLKVRENHVKTEFLLDGFRFDIYASVSPVERQNAYRHFKVMKRLCQLGGKAFQDSIRIRKEQGLKTEPAIADFLELQGDPYDAVLSLESMSNSQLGKLINEFLP